MNPAVKYSLGRVGIFLVVAVPLLLFLPETMNTLLKLMIAIVISAALSFFLLRGWRDQVADQMSANARRKIAEKERLRAALAGEDGTQAGEAGTHGGEDGTHGGEAGAQAGEAANPAGEAANPAGEAANHDGQTQQQKDKV